MAPFDSPQALQQPSKELPRIAPKHQDLPRATLELPRATQEPPKSDPSAPKSDPEAPKRHPREPFLTPKSETNAEHPKEENTLDFAYLVVLPGLLWVTSFEGPWCAYLEETRENRTTDNKRKEETHKE